MSRRRQAFAVFATLLIVVSAVPAPTAGQSVTGDECDPSVVDYGVALMSPATAAYNYATSDGCAVEEVLEGNKEQEKQDIHANSNNMNVDATAFVNGQHNALENARTVAWTKAEVATLKALENNSTQAETRVAARDAVREYYSRMLTNVLRRHNALQDEISYLLSVRTNESLTDDVFKTNEQNITNTNFPVSSYTIINDTSAVRSTYTLPNGSTIELRGVRAEVVLDRSSYDHRAEGPLIPTARDEWTSTGGDTMQAHNWHNVEIHSTYNNSTVSAYDYSDWENLTQSITQQNTQMLSNLNTTVNGLYGSYVRGELDVEEYRSVQAAAMGWGQDLDETGYSTYAVVALAQAGEEVPDLNATGSMTIESSQFQVNGTNETLTGLVVGEPTDGSSSWQVGQTYDPANSNGTVTFHVSGTNRSLELTEPFTLVNAEGKDGGDISTVQTQQYNYRTSNFSELGDKLDNLIELREEQQERIEAASSGGSGGWNWGGLGDVGGLALGGGVVMLILGVALVGVAAKTYLGVVTP